MNETKITELRKARGWTQERLAETSGLAVRTVQRIESGSDASPDTLARIADALEVGVNDLFTHVEDGAFQATVSSLDTRKREQQHRRDAITTSFIRALYAFGVIVLFATFALIGTGTLSPIGWLIIPAYWAGAIPLAKFLFHIVADPRLDDKFPLSHPSRLNRRPRWLESIRSR